MSLSPTLLFFLRVRLIETSTDSDPNWYQPGEKASRSLP